MIWPQQSIEAIKNASVIFLWTSTHWIALIRWGNRAFSNAMKVLIDHHIDPEPIADFILSDTAASSTSEMVYLFIKDMDMADRLDISIGGTFYRSHYGYRIIPL